MGNRAISGNSGVGKSTLAAALCTRGWNLVAEDVTARHMERQTGIGVAKRRGDQAVARRRAKDLALIAADGIRLRRGMQKI